MLSPVITQLERLIAQVKASGPVADASARLDISTHSQSGYDYARLRNGSELSACGRVGSEKYLEVLATLQRRDKISQLRQAIASLKQADAIPVEVPGVGKVDAMPANAPVEKAIAPADKKSAPARPSKPKSAAVNPKKKAKGRKQLYTQVKTRQGSLVHAVLGKDKIGEWRTAALCGAKPPRRDRMGWEFPIHDDGVTCYKCYRKLPANSEPHFPSFG